MTMLSWRPKIILWTMVVLTVALGLALFFYPSGAGRDHAENPAPHAPDQTPR